MSWQTSGKVEIVDAVATVVALIAVVVFYKHLLLTKQCRTISTKTT
jgi:hypothetical protein